MNYKRLVRLQADRLFHRRPPVISSQHASAHKLPRNPVFLFPRREITDHQKLFFPERPGIDIQTLTVRLQQLIDSVNNDFLLFSQCDQLSVIMKYGIRIRQLPRGIYLCIIRIHHNPRRSGRKPCIYAVVPLHRRARVVPAAQREIAQHILRRDLSLSGERPERVDTLDIAVILYPGKRAVFHPELFSLIDIGCSL